MPMTSPAIGENGQRSPCSQGCPGILGKKQPTRPVSCRAQTPTGTPPGQPGSGDAGPGEITRRSHPPQLGGTGHTRANSPCAPPLPGRSDCKILASRSLTSGSLCSSAHVIRLPLCSGDPAPLSFINLANAWLMGRQRQGRGRWLQQADNHRAHPTRQAKLGCFVALGFFFLYVPDFGGFWQIKTLSLGRSSAEPTCLASPHHNKPGHALIKVGRTRGGQILYRQ